MSVSLESFTIEAVSNEEGILENPIIVCNILIKELGMYTCGKYKVWVVPSLDKKQEKSNRKYIVYHEDRLNCYYFLKFNTNGEFVTYNSSEKDAHIFNSIVLAEKAAELMNKLAPNNYWKVNEL